ncbi:MAG: TonB-dependent receptor [Pseudobdellovibrio sp.]
MKIFKYLLVFLYSLQVYAQEDVNLGTITVRGTKDGRSYKTSPESLVILQETEVNPQGKEDDIQVLNSIPNVSVNKNGESFSIRGINNTGVTGYQKDNLASVIVDDLFQTDLALQAGSFSLWDVERVEILRGAQSTQQGVNSLAGAILLDHYKPDFVNSGAVKLGFGSHFNRELGIVLNRSLKDDTAAVRFSYDKSANDGYITNQTTANDKWGSGNKDRASLGVLYKVTDEDSVLFNLKYNRSHQGGTYVQGNDPFAYEVTEDVDFNSITNNSQSTVKYKADINEHMTNDLVVGYSASQQKIMSDADGEPQDIAGARKEKHKDDYLSIENRLTYKNENIHNVFGLHLHRFKLVDNYDMTLLNNFPGVPTAVAIYVLQDVERTQDAYALFNALNYKLNDNYSVQLGVRGEKVNSSYDTYAYGRRLTNAGGANTAIDNYINSITGVYGGSNDGFVVLPKVGFGYTNENHFTGLTYTKGYRTSGVSINRSKAAASSYDPEYTDNYELSYKYFTEEWQTSMNVFYIHWRQQQVQVQLSNDVYDTQVKNAAQSEVYGAELEGKLKINAQQSLSSGVGYTNTQFKDFKTSNKDYSGKEFPFASKWTGRIAHEIKATETLSFITIARYMSPAYTNADNTRTSEQLFNVSLNAKYMYETWVLEGYVNNVFDQKYQLFDGSPTSTTSAYQASYHQVNAPREFGVRFNYYW